MNTFPCPRCGRPIARRPRAGQTGRPAARRDAPEIRCPRCRFLMFDYPRPCVGMIVVRGPDLLLLRRGHRPKRGYLDLPGGFLEAGEAIEAGARRELYEETGLRIGPTELLGIYWDRYHLKGFGYFPTMNFYFMGRWRSGEPKPADDAAGALWRPIATVGRRGERLAWRHMRVLFRDLRKRVASGGRRPA